MRAKRSNPDAASRSWHSFDAQALLSNDGIVCASGRGAARMDDAKNDVGRLDRAAGVWRPRGGAKFPFASNHHRGAVLGRRAVGRDGADAGRTHAAVAWPDRADRECHGRGRFARRRPRGALARRRLHHQLRPSRHQCRQRRDLQARLRPRHRSRAGGDAAEQPDDHRQQERRSGQNTAGTAGVAEGKTDARRPPAPPAPARAAISPGSISRTSPASSCNTCPIAAPRRR